jgi:hypothetical protein
LALGSCKQPSLVDCEPSGYSVNIHAPEYTASQSARQESLCG